MLSFTCLLTTVYVLFFSLDGVRVLSRFDAAVYTARRTEMLEIVEATLFYLVDRPVVHSEVSGLPFMVSFISCVSFALIYYQSSYFSILVLWAYWVLKLICTLLGLNVYCSGCFTTILPIGTSFVVFGRATRVSSTAQGGSTARRALPSMSRFRTFRSCLLNPQNRREAFLLYERKLNSRLSERHFIIYRFELFDS